MHFDLSLPRVLRVFTVQMKLL